jgi:ankyrin repeat protein
MVSELIRKRKHIDTVEPSSSHPLADAVTARPELSPFQSRRKIDHDSTTPAEHFGHQYHRNCVGGNARVHFGNVFNYGSVPPKNPWARFLESLKFDSMGRRLASINSAYAQTCNWIFDIPEFSQWRDTALEGSNCGILSIKGNPGAGKSTLMKCIYEHFKMSKPSHTVISFFFNARGESLESSVEGMYRSMLFQILEGIPKLRTDLATPHSTREKQNWTLETLQDLFRQAVLCLQDEPLICIVDGLDECKDQQEVRCAMYFLRNLTISAQNLHLSFGICLASRHYPSMTIPFSQEIIVESLKAHAEGIETYILDNLIVSPEAVRERLRHGIQRKANGVFQWVVLVVDLLNKKSESGTTHTQLEASLRKIPEDLNNLFSSICCEGASDKYFLLALQWILFAKRRLTVQELYFGIRSSAGELTTALWDRDVIDLENMGRFVLHAGKGMVELSTECSQQPHVQFIHESVREHLLAGGLASLDSCLPSSASAAGHMKLAESSLAYAQLVLNQSLDIEIRSCLCDETTLEKDDFPLLEYVWDWMISHMEEAYVGGLFDVNALKHLPLNGLIDVVCQLGILYKRPRCLRNLLYFLLQDGHIALVEALLRSQISLRGTDDYEQTTNDLVDGVNEDPFSDPDLYSCADLPRSEDYFGCPLSLALYLNETSVVQLLLDCGADVSGHNKWYNSPLNVAVHWKEVDIVRFLLDHGADANVRAPFEKTPLSTAISQDKTETVQLLLERGAEINLEDGFGETPLSRAVSQGTTETVRLLLECGANANVEGATGARPLTVAICEDRMDLLELLLQFGADVNIDLHTTSNPLSLAAHNGNLDALQILLDYGANTNMSNGPFGSALSVAARHSQMAGVELLLRHGAEVNFCAAEFYSPLMVAAVEGRQDVVHLLLDWGAKIILVRPDIRYGGQVNEITDQDIMHLLLDHGKHAGIEIQDTVSYWAQAAGRCDVNTMKRLVQLGADPNARDENCRTALHIIADGAIFAWLERNSHKENADKERDRASALQALLNLGADVNAVGGEFGSALIAASSRGNLRDVQLFLDYGADPNVCSPVYGTPIDAAHAGGHREICRMLGKSLKRGKVERGAQDELQASSHMLAAGVFTKVGYALLSVTTSLRDKFGF